MFEMGGPPSSSLQKEERVTNITICMLGVNRIKKDAYKDIDHD